MSSSSVVLSFPSLVLALDVCLELESGLHKKAQTLSHGHVRITLLPRLAKYHLHAST